MFDFLKEHKRIIVTGPHRAGTTFASEIIAEDLGYRLAAENQFAASPHPSASFKLFWDKLFGWTQGDQCVVLHSPGISAYVHLFDAMKPAVVFMRRAVEDIVASEKRIKWQGQEKRLIKDYYRDEGILPAVKYEIWEKYQKPIITHAYDLEYESLSAHPKWIPKDQRVQFKPHQTKL